MDIPEKDILIENKSKNTYENAKFSAQVIKEHELSPPFLLISSAEHLPRAKKCFDKQKVKTDLFSANLDTEIPLSVSDYFMPNAKTLRDWEKLMHEIVGTLGYRIAGYI